MRKASFTILAIIIALLAYGSLIEPRFILDETEYEVELPALSPEWEGKKIALVADFQIGMWGGNTGMVHNAIENAIENSVDLVLIAGDFLYSPDSSVVDEAVGAVRPLVEAGIPTVAVLGNHDYSLMKEKSERVDRYADYLEARLEEIGVTVLENEATPISAGGDTLWVVGLGSVWAEIADVNTALADVPAGAPRVWLMHNAEAFRNIPAEEAHLAFAAHTHGGQIRIFPGDHYSWLDIIKEKEVIADGWAADSLGAEPNRVYVNRGIGFSTVPFRFNCPPELSTFTLRQPTGQVPSADPEEDNVTDA